MNISHDGKGEWQAVYEAKPNFDGHRLLRASLWGIFEITLI